MEAEGGFIVKTDEDNDMNAKMIMGLVAAVVLGSGAVMASGVNESPSTKDASAEGFVMVNNVRYDDVGNYYTKEELAQYLSLMDRGVDQTMQRDADDSRDPSIMSKRDDSRRDYRSDRDDRYQHRTAYRSEYRYSDEKRWERD